MTDEELIAHLRLQGLDKDIAAADCIEQLVKENHQLATALSGCNIAWDQALHQRDEAKAKLAKAGIAAIEKILDERGPVFDAMVEAAEDADLKHVSFNVVMSRAIRAALDEMEKTK